MFFIEHNFEENYETHFSGHSIVGGGNFFCRAAAVSGK